MIFGIKLLQMRIAKWYRMPAPGHTVVCQPVRERSLFTGGGSVQIRICPPPLAYHALRFCHPSKVVH